MNSHIQQQLQRAQTLFENNADDEAITAFLAILPLLETQDVIERTHIHHYLAILYDRKHDYHQALLHYRHAIHSMPEFILGHYHLGLFLLKYHQFAAAKVQFNNVIALDPDHIQAYFYLGILSLGDNQLDEAQSAFETILRIEPEHVEALCNLGVIALKRDLPQHAIDYFTKALALKPNHLEARNNLAATFIHHDRFENALMHYDVLLKAAPKEIEYLYNSGVAEMSLGHLQEAIIHFEDVLSVSAKHFASLTNLAAIYSRLEDKEKAIDYLKQALAANPKDEATQFQLKALSNDPETPQASTTYITHLFNNYAGYYEAHMQQTLQYQLPQYIMRGLHELQVVSVSRSLDVGCGTGLMGIPLREISSTLVGVDISEKMLKEAERKEIYNTLVESEILDYFQQHQDSFNVIVAADVLPYFGDLEQLFTLVHSHLEPQGLFAFSIEPNQGETPWHLQTTARFCHRMDYIQSIIEQCGFESLYSEDVIGRQQQGENLHLMVYIVQVKSKK